MKIADLKWRIKEGIKGALSVMFGGLIHTPIHEWLHWLPAKLFGLNPTDIVIRPFEGGYLGFSYDSPLSVLALMIPMWVLIPLGLMMIITGWTERKTLMTGIGLVFFTNELIYQIFCESDMWKLGITNGILSFIIVMVLMVIGYLVTRKNQTYAGRPAILRRIMHRIRTLRLPDKILKRRER